MKKYSKLAIAALLLAILSLCALGILMLLPPRFSASCLVPLTFFSSLLAGLIIGIIALVSILRNSANLKGKPLAILAIILSGGTLAAVVLYPVVWNWWEHSHYPRQPTCLSNIKQLALATLMYADDWNGRLPLAKNWSDGLLAYVKSKKLYVCSETKNQTCSYAFNKNLSGKKLAEIKDPANTVLIFESDLGWNHAGTYFALPSKTRHYEGDNYGFADAHAKWFYRKDAQKLKLKP